MSVQLLNVRLVGVAGPLPLPAVADGHAVVRPGPGVCVHGRPAVSGRLAVHV